MQRTTWAIVALSYLAFAEVLSWTPVPDLALCLIEPSHNEQPANHDDKKYCPAFHAGAALVFERADHFLEAHDKSVIGAFTIVLAISTIGLWLATSRLWAAGERQIATTQASVDVARRSAEIAENSVVELQRALLVINSFRVDTLMRGPNVIGYQISAVFENVGNTIARRYAGTANVVVWDGELPSDFAYADRQVVGPANGFVGPRIQTHFPIGIALSDCVEVAEKRQRGFMYGWVEYEDVFDATPTRRTEFCVQIEVIGQPHIPNQRGATLAFAGYGPYNGTDQDCFYKPGHRPPIGGLPEPTQPPPEAIISL